MSVRHLYYGYARVARRLVDGVRELDAEALALGPPNWPICAIASHVAGTRVFWLCRVAGELGSEATPFADSDGDGALSREEAAKSLPRIARKFDRIDADRDGRLTLEEMHAWLQTRSRSSNRAK